MVCTSVNRRSFADGTFSTQNDPPKGPTGVEGSGDFRKPHVSPTLHPGDGEYPRSIRRFVPYEKNKKEVFTQTQYDSHPYGSQDLKTDRGRESEVRVRQTLRLESSGSFSVRV